MFYRIVLQGRAAGDHDLATVKREFARVTGLSEHLHRAVVRAGAPVDPRRDRASRCRAHRCHPSCHRRRRDGRARRSHPSSPSATARTRSCTRGAAHDGAPSVGVPLAVAALVVFAPMLSDASCRCACPAKEATPGWRSRRRWPRRSRRSRPEPPNARVLHGPGAAPTKPPASRRTGPSAPTGISLFTATRCRNSGTSRRSRHSIRMGIRRRPSRVHLRERAAGLVRRGRPRPAPPALRR